jgi:coenzyme PQQ precursor peptide PqqA
MLVRTWRLATIQEEATMKTWATPKLIEICIGMEVTGYESAEGDTLH